MTLKTLSLSLQENTEDFSTLSYLTLTVHKDDTGIYVYSLAEFTAQQGVRDTTDIMEKYRKGVLGALPDPERIRSLLSLKGNRKEVPVNGE